MVSEDSPNAARVKAIEDDHLSSDADSREEDKWPKGTVYPLNSKRIVMEQLRRLAKMLEVSTDGSSDMLRQLIEGKLMQLDHEPPNMQVIVSCKDARLCLVDESGIINKDEHASHEKFVSAHTDHESHMSHVHP